MGASWGGFRTTLVFSGTEQVSSEQMAASASLEYRLSQRWTLSGAAGGVLWGELGTKGQTYRMGPGAVGSFAASFTALEQGEYNPFLMFSGSIAASYVSAQPTRYAAIDARLGTAVGYTFFERLTPYVTGRVFGGPVFWNDQTGTDRYHFQVGAGAVVGLPFKLDASVEVVPLGEQRLSLGLGWAF